MPDDFITGEFPCLCLEDDLVEDGDDAVWSGFCEDRLDSDGLCEAAIVLLSAVTITKVTVNVIGFKFNTNKVQW